MRSVSRFAAALILATLLGGCTRGAPVAQAPALTPLDARRDSVLTAALEDSPKDSVLLSPDLTDDSETADSSRWLGAQTWLHAHPGLRAMALRLWRANRAVVVLAEPPPLPGRVIELTRLKPPPGISSTFWLTRLSQPAFNQRGDSALVWYAVHCGSLCGLSDLDLVVRKDGHWVVTDHLDVGIS